MGTVAQLRVHWSSPPMHSGTVKCRMLIWDERLELGDLLRKFKTSEISILCRLCFKSVEPESVLWLRSHSPVFSDDSLTKQREIECQHTVKRVTSHQERRLGSFDSVERLVAKLMSRPKWTPVREPLRLRTGKGTLFHLDIASRRIRYQIQAIWIFDP